MLILLEMIRWSAVPDPVSPASEGFLDEFETDRDAMIARFRERAC